MTEDTLSENTEESDTGNVGDELNLDWAMPSDFPPEHVFMYSIAEPKWTSKFCYDSLHMVSISSSYPNRT